MTHEQFISKEIATWGEDHVFELLDAGYMAIELTNGTHTKWTWALTNGSLAATVVRGSGAGFTPVFPAFRASRTNAT